MENLLQVGVITSTHGIRGEVKVFPTTDDKNRFKKLKQVILDTEKEKLTLSVESVRFFKQFVILKFKEFHTINEIECYKGKSLYVTRENAVPLKKDEYFIADLIGINVIDEKGDAFGVLKDVLVTGANDVYVVTRTDGSEVLLPAIKECILSVDTKERIMKVHLMKGLLEA